MPPMMTAQVRTATVTPTIHVGVPKTVFTASAMEFGCVNGVVVSAATPATNAKIHASAGDFRPSRR